MTEEKLSENEKLLLVNEILKIKREKDLYKFVIKLKPEVVVDLIYLMPKKKHKYVCFLVFALCDFYGKMNQEEPLLYFVSLLADRGKRDVKFRKEINGTLNFMLQDEGRPKVKDTEEIKPPVKPSESSEEKPIEPPKDSEE
jgi:hypothetical protein